MVWELIRAAALTAFCLLFLSTASGIILSYKRLNGEGYQFVHFLHDSCSVGGLIFVIIHMMLLLFDQYVHFSILNIVLPFSTSYKPFSVALGIGTFYIFVLIILTSAVVNLRKKHMKLWHVIHLLAYPAFFMGLFHGLLTGTDASRLFVTLMYYAAGVTVLTLSTFRVFFRPVKRRSER